MVTVANLSTRARLRTAVYWAATIIIVAESLVGGVMDILRLAPFYPALHSLGYPAYFSTMLGVAKVAAGIVILAPRLPRLKEWAYAGISFNMAAAVASHVAVRDGVGNLVAPLMFLVLILASWALRPADRRLSSAGRLHG